MTFKHIPFIESPVMREFARVAAKKGLVEAAPEIVKSASAESESKLQIHDFYGNLVNLANGLRNKGMIKEAESLEDKIFTLKQAEVHLYRAIDEDGDDLLNAAYPDGDVSVSDAKDGNGIVRTPQSAHKKMVEVVSKNPTGKYASGEETLEKVAEALGLKKKAQVDPNDSAQEVEGLFQKRDPESEIKVEKINKLVSESVPVINAGIQNQIAVTERELNFSGNFLTLATAGNEAVLALYEKYSGVEAARVKNHFMRREAAFGDRYNPNVKVLFQKINAMNSDEAQGFVRQVAPRVDIFKFIPPPPADTELQTGWDKIKNVVKDVVTTSAGGWVPVAGKWLFSFEKDSKVTHNLVNSIVADFKAEFDEFFSSDKIESANAKLKNTLAAAVNPMKEAAMLLSEIKPLSLNANSNELVLNSVMAVKQKAEEFFKNKEAMSEISSASAALGTAVDFKPVLAAIVTLDNEIKALPITAMDVVPVNEELDGLANAFNIAAQKVAVYAKNNIKEDTVEWDAARQQANTLIFMKNAILKAKGRPTKKLLESVSAIMPVKSMDELKGLASYYQEQASKLASGKQNELVKLAQPIAPPPSAGAKPVPTAGKPVGKAPVAKAVTREQATSGMAPDGITEVANMQYALSEFAGMINNPHLMQGKLSGVYKQGDAQKIWSTGPGQQSSIHRFDGRWGPNTNTSVQTAAKYIKSLGIGDLVIKQHWAGNYAELEQAKKDAKYNTNLLYKAMSAAGHKFQGQVNQDGLDSLPSVLSENTTDEGTVTLTEKDLSSLAALVNFISINNINTSGLTGEWTQIEEELLPSLSFTGWQKLLSWLRKRAKEQYNKVGAELKSIKTKYFNLIGNLWKQLQALEFRSLDSSDAIPYSTLISPARKGQNWRNPGEKEDGRGSAYSDRSGRDGVSTDGEGGNSLTAPVGRNINLDRPEFTNISIETALRRMNIDRFERFTGPQLAPMFFNGEPGSVEQLKKFNGFLRQMIQSLSPAVSQWISKNNGKVPEEQLDEASNWQARWNTVLMRKINEVAAYKGV